jgi:peptidylprolyl isomerase/FKBP-type peptidyl-prolyl cis-trans isomerase FkpA
MKFLKENISVIVSLLVVAGIIFLVIYFLMSQEVKTDPLKGINKVGGEMEQVDPNAQAPQLEEPNTSQNNMEKISKNGDTLVMNYTGRLVDGTVFDSNVDPKFSHVTPFEFTLGAGQVIAGWDEGLVGMKVGEKKTLTIPPEKGYGSRATGSIPANSTLIFDVELVGIK